MTPRSRSSSGTWASRRCRMASGRSATGRPRKPDQPREVVEAALATRYGIRSRRPTRGPTCSRAAADPMDDWCAYLGAERGQVIPMPVTVSGFATRAEAAGVHPDRPSSGKRSVSERAGGLPSARAGSPSSRSRRQLVADARFEDDVQRLLGPATGGVRRRARPGAPGSACRSGRARVGGFNQRRIAIANGTGRRVNAFRAFSAALRPLRVTPRSPSGSSYRPCGPAWTERPGRPLVDPHRARRRSSASSRGRVVCARQGGFGDHRTRQLGGVKAY